MADQRAGSKRAPRKKRTPKAATPAPVTQDVPKFLSAEDLRDFQVRRNAVDQAVMSARMVQTGYEVWCQALRKKYGISVPFDVHLQTGEIVLRPEGKGK